MAEDKGTERKWWRDECGLRCKCYLTEGCEGAMIHALLGSFCPECGIEIDFHGDVVPPDDKK